MRIIGGQRVLLSQGLSSTPSRNLPSSIQVRKETKIDETKIDETKQPIRSYLKKKGENP
jgi:hypothetical protein